MKEDRAAIANVLSNTREQNGMSQKGTAHRIGVHLNTIVRWERGERSIPVETFIDYCIALNIDPARVIAHAIRARRSDNQQK